MFNGLARTGRVHNWPPINTLSNSLNDLVGSIENGYKHVDNKIIGYFATASVEMWHRALHSFLISASLTTASPLWASVAGYYSSHYTMRAIAHLLGYYQLFTKKRIVQLDLRGQTYVCIISKKDGNEREHRVYWKIVKQNGYFANDPFFYHNIDVPPAKFGSEFKSDGGHRNRANYADHVGSFAIFNPLSEETLKKRIQKLSGIEINDVAMPDVNLYPDLDNVQLLAYHRILKYRAFLDDIFPERNRFWTIHRNPSWCPEYFDFQAVKADYSGMLNILNAG